MIPYAGLMGGRMSCSSSSLFICNLTSYRATDPNTRYQIAGVVITPVVGVLAAPTVIFENRYKKDVLQAWVSIGICSFSYEWQCQKHGQVPPYL